MCVVEDGVCVCVVSMSVLLGAASLVCVHAVFLAELARRSDYQCSLSRYSLKVGKIYHL